MRGYFLICALGAAVASGCGPGAGTYCQTGPKHGTQCYTGADVQPPGARPIEEAPRRGEPPATPPPNQLGF